jgi:hypothetical protein
MMDEIDPLLLKLDELITSSRLEEIAFIMSADSRRRISRMAKALRHLRPGAYLLGAGPYTLGVIRLTADEVVLGRCPTLLEQPSDVAVHYTATDTLYFVPREVSRVHARVVPHRTNGRLEYVVTDLHSTCGTYVNGTRVDPDGQGVGLSYGDILSLGPSQVSAYLFYTVNGL